MIPTYESVSRAPSPEADGDRDGDGDDDDDSEWRFGADDIGPDDIIDDGPETEQLPIEPEPPWTENIVFVLLDALLAVGLVVVIMYPDTS